MILSLVGLIILVILALYILKYPEFGYFSLFFLIPLNRYSFNIDNFNLSLDNLFILLTLLSIFIGKLIHGYSIKRDRNYLILFWLLLAIILTSFSALDPISNLRVLITLIGCMFIYFLSINLVTNKIILKRSILCLWISSTIFSLFGIIQFLIYIIWKIDWVFLGRINLISILGLTLPRGMSVFSDPNFFAFFLLPGFISMLYFFLQKRDNNHSKLMLFIFVFITLTGLFLSFSRGAYLAAFGGILCIIFINIKKKIPKLVFPSAFILFLFILGIVIVSKIINVAIIYDTFLNINPISVELHYMNWSYSLYFFKQNPIFGIGLGSFKQINPLYYVSHNSFLEVLVSLGIFGFLPFCLMLVWSLKSSISLSKHLSHKMSYVDYSIMAFSASLVTLIIASIVISTYALGIFWISLGLLNASLNIKKKICNKKSI